MPNEVTPTQADCEAAEQVRAAARSLSLTRRMENGLCLPSPVEKPWLEQAFAAHRIAHEAPLLARNAELEARLGRLQVKWNSLCNTGTETVGTAREIPFGNPPRAALTTKDTSHDA